MKNDPLKGLREFTRNVYNAIPVEKVVRLEDVAVAISEQIGDDLADPKFRSRVSSALQVLYGKELIVHVRRNRYMKEATKAKDRKEALAFPPTVSLFPEAQTPVLAAPVSENGSDLKTTREDAIWAYVALCHESGIRPSRSFFETIVQLPKAIHE